MNCKLLLIPLIALTTAACASAQAKGKGKPADKPPLNVPAAPARIVEPAPEPAPEPLPVADLPPPPPLNRPARPPAARPEAAPPAEAPKPDPPKPEAPKPDTPPAGQLRTPQTSDTSGAAKTVRSTIDTARGILNGVNFGPLSNERKKAYNDAKVLLQQAEDALKEGNLAFAQGVASKAETLAKELANR